MRIIVASCSVVYSGRGDTKLPEAVRAIIIKSDGAVSVHHDAGTKPLNYMGKGNTVTITEATENTPAVWTFDTRKESLQVTIHQLISDLTVPLDVDNSVLERDGTEFQLQAWIAENPECLGEGFRTVQREYPTGAGAVDLLVEDSNGNPVAVEVKRVAMIGAVDQASRYVEALKTLPGFENVYGMVAALDVRPNTHKLAEKRGIRCVSLPNTWNSVVSPGSEETPEP